jgi:integrase
MNLKDWQNQSFMNRLYRKQHGRMEIFMEKTQKDLHSYEDFRKYSVEEIAQILGLGKTKTLDAYCPNTVRNDFIISTQNGMFPTSRNIQVTLDRILKKCKLPHYGTHALRHTFATLLLSKTKSHQEIKAVAELLGDDYKVVINTYLHTNDDGKHNLVDMLLE